MPVPSVTDESPGSANKRPSVSYTCARTHTRTRARMHEHPCCPACMDARIHTRVRASCMGVPDGPYPAIKQSAPVPYQPSNSESLTARLPSPHTAPLAVSPSTHFTPADPAKPTPHP
eukprot:363918-Chlamydomonas_euryale.AAC.5